MEIELTPAFSISLKSSVLTVEFSPFEWSRSLLAVALPSSLIIYNVKFKEEKEAGETSYTVIWECFLSSNTVALAWSPASTIQTVASCLKVMVATGENCIFELTTDLEGSHSKIPLHQHSDSINSIAYSGDSGNMAASTGDDLVVKVWNTDTGDSITTFLLSSPGVTVRFHPENGDILLVGERNGILRLYCISSNSAVRSLRCPSPMLSADWSLIDSSLVVSSGPRGITTWNMSMQQPTKESTVIGGGNSIVTHVALCRSQLGLVSTVSNPHTLRISNIQSSKIPAVAELKVLDGLTWHHHLPYLAVGSDRKVLLYKVTSV